jgi:hypothetical protein
MNNIIRRIIRMELQSRVTDYLLGQSI